MNNSPTNFKIHPSIGIARLGNMEDDFYLAPEQPGALPIMCDAEGKEQVDKSGTLKRVTQFKDSSNLSKIKKQAARFKIFAYDNEEDTEGTEIKVDGKYSFIFENAITAPTVVEGTVQSIDWMVHLANKKSSWYEFQETAGIHGYAANHPLRNAEVNQPDLRRQLIIDPGPVTVNLKNNDGHFAKYGSATKKLDKSKYNKVAYPQTFPPSDILPNPIETLGRVMVNKQDDHLRLIVLGGNGNSGSTKTPVISNYANNDGWFDDISDGPVRATIHYTYEMDVNVYNPKTKKTTKKKKKVSATMDVQMPAWVVVGYPRYVPEMEDMITMDEKMYDLFVRKMAYDPQVFGVAPYDKASNSPKTSEEFDIWRNDAHYNPEYYPKYFKEIWPMFRRPDDYAYTYDFDHFAGSDPHNRGTGGNLDMSALSKVPENGEDPNARLRKFIYGIMRDPSQLNDYTIDGDYSSTNNKSRLMPMLCGNNPITNVVPEKFLSMTATQLFFLKQWVEGKFVNECNEWGADNKNCETPWSEPPTTGIGIDRGILSNVLGGAFCPGGELSWIVDNPAIYSEPYRIKHADYIPGSLSIPKPIADMDGSTAPDLSKGLEPGDLTKYIGIPWQSDFHECTYMDINMTYKSWVNIELDSIGDPEKNNQEIAYNVPWWPAHRPRVITSEKGDTVYWTSGIPENNAGDLQMVEAWKDLGFLKMTDPVARVFSQQERNEKALGPNVAPDSGIKGRTKGKTN